MTLRNINFNVTCKLNSFALKEIEPQSKVERLNKSLGELDGSVSFGVEELTLEASEIQEAVQALKELCVKAIEADSNIQLAKEQRRMRRDEMEARSEK